LRSHPADSFKLFTEEVDTVRPKSHIIKVRDNILNTGDTGVGEQLTTNAVRFRWLSSISNWWKKLEQSSLQ
jgi:hypothetical protein